MLGKDELIFIFIENSSSISYFILYFVFNTVDYLAEHLEEGGSHSRSLDGSKPHFASAQSVDEIDDESDSDNGEFITIKVTNEEGKTEQEEVDHIKEHKEHKEHKAK